MTTLRQPYYELSPTVYNALVQAKTALENSTLETTLMELVYLRVSQSMVAHFVWRCTAKHYANPVCRSISWMPWQAGA